MRFKIDVKKLGVLFIPPYLRNSKMVAWIKSLLSPIENLYYDFIQNRDLNIYKLQHNAQICHFRKSLNDHFDNEKRRIQITDGNRYKRVYIYTDVEIKPKYLNTMFLRDDADYADTGVDFLVLLPEDLQYNKHEMTSLIDFYKLASKRYKTQTI